MQKTLFTRPLTLSQFQTPLINSFDTIQHFSNYLSNRVSDSIFLKSPSTTEISEVILSLNRNKAVGHNDISAYFLKVASTIIAPYLQCFFEFSFLMAYFLKTAHLLKSHLFPKKEIKQT